ncbi:hypothetical protein Q5424_08100, partial [Conexibacter sp. JD483]
VRLAATPAGSQGAPGEADPGGSGDPGARGGSGDGGGPGDEPPAELTATATIAPDPLPRSRPATLSADRRRLTLTLSDTLLEGAAPRCLVVRSHGLADGAPAEAGADEQLSAWFDGQAPPGPNPDPPSDPRPHPGARDPPPSGATPGVDTPPQSLRRCDRRQPAGLTWDPFPRELAVGGTALVPVQARDGRDVRAVVASLTTFAGSRKVGAPLLVALPPRGYALKLQAPPQRGRLDAQLTWQEQRDRSSCADKSRSFRIAVVPPRAPRLTIAGTPRRLAFSWGLKGRDCHALLARGLRLRVEGFGQRRAFRVATPCDGWEDPGAALPDLAVERDGQKLLLSPLGDEPGLWQYRVSAFASGRTLLRRTLSVEIAQRGDAVVRTITLQHG